MIDVYEALWGPDRDAELRASITSGMRVAKVRCACGRTIASIYAHDSRVWSMSAGTRTTRQETAADVIHSALRDVETIANIDAERGEHPMLDQALDIITTFLLDSVSGDGKALKARVSGVVSATRFPDQALCLDELPEARREGIFMSRERGVMPGKFAFVSPTCPGCRSVWYLGDDLADWMEITASRRPPAIVASTRTEPFDVSHRTAIDYDDARLETLGRRVALYAHLTGVLKSASHRKVKSAT